MTRDVIPFRAAAASRTGRAPDVAFEALPLLRRLRDTLERAAAFRDACRRAEAAARWGVPPLFFFDKAAQAEWAADRPADRFPDPFAVPVAERYPDAAAAWAELYDLTADALTLMAGSVEVRRTARVVPRLRSAADALAADHPACRQLAGVLAIPDDWTVLALHPAARAGFRLRLRGVADLYQFHALLADAVAGPPARGLLPGPRPDGRVVEAYRDGPVDPAADVATARFQLYRPSALRPDGTLPPAFRGADHWLWGHESPADVPVVNGERVVLLGDPPYPRCWPVGRRFPLIRGELDLLGVLAPAAVDGWLWDLAGVTPPAELTPARRAA